jgi:hypothetical protein
MKKRIKNFFLIFVGLTAIILLYGSYSLGKYNERMNKTINDIGFYILYAILIDKYLEEKNYEKIGHTNAWLLSNYIKIYDSDIEKYRRLITLGENRVKKARGILEKYNIVYHGKPAIIFANIFQEEKGEEKVKEK